MSATEGAEPDGTASVAGLAVVTAAPYPPLPISAPSTPLVTRAAAAQRRVVALAPDAVELLRPASDLARILTSFGRADVLFAAEAATLTADEDDPEDDPEDRAPGGEHEDPVRGAVAELGHPDLAVHRLGLTPPLRPDMEHDLVAAMSELVGFDPEPLVYCLAPADPCFGVLARTAERIAQVYGLPLLRYRCLELALADPWDPDPGAVA